MDTQKKNNGTAKPGQLLPDKDVLGQQKPQASGTSGIAKPGRIFIGLAVAIVLAIVYWLLTGK